MIRKMFWLVALALAGCSAEKSSTVSTAAPATEASEGEHLVAAVDTAAFDLLMKSNDKPMLVDFWAEWCGPCRELAPAVEEIAGTYQDQLTVVKVNVDEAAELAQRFQIEAIPTLIIFRGGQEVTRVVGPPGKDAIVEALAPVLR